MGDNSVPAMVEDPIERATLALPDIEQDRVAHGGEPRFKVISAAEHLSGAQLTCSPSHYSSKLSTEPQRAMLSREWLR